MHLTEKEKSTLVHALRGNARSDRERVTTLRAEMAENGMPQPEYKALIEIFEAQATEQEALAEKIEADEE